SCRPVPVCTAGRRDFAGTGKAGAREQRPFPVPSTQGRRRAVVARRGRATGRKGKMDMSDMFKVFRKEVDWAGRKLVLETGKGERQADGAVVATYGGTTVLATVVFEKKPKPGLDFFPLTVNYQEKAFAAGKIPGGFFKREGRPSEKEVLTSRTIARPIRPLFHESFRNVTLVVITTLAHDMENDPDIL